jgi:hypothetical protein
VLAALTQFFSLAAQPDGLRTWAENASLWHAPPALLGLPDPPALTPASPGDPAEFTRDPAEGVAAFASSMDAEARVSIEDPEPVSPVGVAVETEPAASPADAGWFF